MTYLVVDGMNVIGSTPDGWWRDRDGAVRRLLADLQGLARCVDDVVVALALDGWPLPDVPQGVHGGVQVVYARRSGPDAADDRIVELVAALADPTDATVITSDRALAQQVRALGASVQGAGSLLRRFDR